MTATTNPTTDTPRHVRLAEHANAIADNAGRGWGTLEATERAASAAWASVDHAAREAGDNATAEYARDRSRFHWKNAERLRVEFHNAHGTL